MDIRLNMRPGGKGKRLKLLHAPAMSRTGTPGGPEQENYWLNQNFGRLQHRCAKNHQKHSEWCITSWRGEKTQRRNEQLLRKEFEKSRRHAVWRHTLRVLALTTMNIRSFSQPTGWSSVKRHIASVHDSTKYQCPQCDKTFTDASSLKRHIASVHDSTKYQHVWR